MKARAFAYARPSSLAEAHAAFAGADGDASYISGGQSLVPALAMRLQAPQVLIDLSAIPEMRGVRLEGENLSIGALTRHAETLTEPLIRAHAPLLAAAAPFVAHPAIRNRGTVGGSVALADPASEFPAMMLAMGAEMEISGSDGMRRVPADDYFQDLYQTAIEPGEILVALHVPAAGPRHVCAFDEMARRRGDYAMVGGGILAERDGAVIANPRIALFSVGSTPVRARNAEAEIAGKALDADTIAAAQRALDADIDPLDDAEIPAAMRRHLARVLLGRLLRKLETCS
ncbi:xanthine dehydrogenase family protein subunit M [Xanthobacter sp. SG618]|uniref:FAD binding domain-containing protein n=1 Tax=Xanthobacter sp. SG618 TaxID=2587121 RepID=UPI00145E616A|nr:FAD binding domain-containing protein [Xanthobacter sp. SG618]